MYTKDCKNPNCQQGEGHNSMEECPSKIPEKVGQNPDEERQMEFRKTVSDEIIKDENFTAKDRRNCFLAHKKLKEQVQSKVGVLIQILRKREADLIQEIDEQYSARMKEIDKYAIDWIVRRIYGRDKYMFERLDTRLLFDSDFDDLKQNLECFGQLSCETDFRGHCKRYPYSWTRDITPGTPERLTFRSPFECAQMMPEPPATCNMMREIVMPGKVKGQDGFFNNKTLAIKTLGVSEGNSKTIFKAELPENDNFRRLKAKVLEKEKSEYGCFFNKTLPGKSPVASEEDSKLVFKGCGTLPPGEQAMIDILNDELLKYEQRMSSNEFQKSKESSDAEHKRWLAIVNSRGKTDFKTNIGDDDKGQVAHMVLDSTKRNSPLLNEEDSKTILKDKLPGALEPEKEAVKRAMDVILFKALEELKKRTSPVLNEEDSKIILKDKLPGALKPEEKAARDDMGELLCRMKCAMTSDESFLKFHEQWKADQIRRERQSPVLSEEDSKIIFKDKLPEALEPKMKSPVASEEVSRTIVKDKLPEVPEAEKNSTKNDITEFLCNMKHAIASDGSFLKFQEKWKAHQIQTKRTSPVLNEEDSKIILKDKLPGALEPKDPATLAELVQDRLKEIPLQKASLKDSFMLGPPEDSLPLLKKGKVKGGGGRRRRACLRPQEKVMVDPQQPIRIDEPEALSTQIKKKFENLVISEGSEKREAMVNPSLASANSVPNEDEWDLDEKDIEIIHPFELTSIPSDVSFSPSLPPKNRFVCKRPAFFNSLMRKKGDKKNCQSPKSAESESSGIGESESRGTLVSNAGSSVGSAGMKENPSFDEQMDQGSPSASKDDRDEDLGQCNDPTVALRSSFSKYFEKMLESEWLAPGQSLEQSENNSRNSIAPNQYGPGFEQWLPRSNFPSDWLHR